MASWLPGVLVALVGIIPGILVFWQAGQARKQSALKASKDEVREAFDQAKSLYQAGIDEAQRRIENCNRRVTSLEADVEAARTREQALRRWIRQLEDALRREGIPVPNGEPP
jgi:nitrogen fixation/metabolism regulation signal transduction histidine kinase